MCWTWFWRHLGLHHGISGESALGGRGLKRYLGHWSSTFRVTLMVYELAGYSYVHYGSTKAKIFDAMLNFCLQ